MKKDNSYISNYQFCWIILIIFFISLTSQAQTYFGQQNIISDVNELKPTKIYSSDIDGDGDMDVIIAFSYEYILVWYENIDGLGNFGEQQVVSSYVGNVTSIFATDIDGDNDIDVLAATGCHSEIVWYENTDGEGSFGEEQIITSETQFAFCVYAADIDGDGDMDIISASRDDDKIAWYQNDGYGNFGEQFIISTSIEGARSVYAIDFDGDDDIDVLSGAYWGDYVAWHENIDGNGNFSEPKIITHLADHVTSVFACDLDGDEDMDVLSASYSDDKIAWYENDGLGNFGVQQAISTSSDGAADVYSADLDSDGDMDVISSSIIDDNIIWHENTDGSGGFTKEHVISSIMGGPMSIYAVDINGDFDIDILSTFYDENIAIWFENYTLKILDQPQSQEICPKSNISFFVIAEDASDYQWQINNGNGFIDLIDNNTYSGVNSNILNITSASIAMSGSQYRCTLSNPGGSLASGEATLLVVDEELPIILSSHPNLSLYANHNCEVSLPDYTIDVVANDNCDINLEIVQTPNVGTNISGLTNTVIIEVIDDANNSKSVSFNVEVLDTIAPLITSTHINQSLEANIDCEATLHNYTNNLITVDNCDNNLTIVQIPGAGTKVSGLTNIVTLLVTDDADNNTSVSFNIEVLDKQPPNLVCVDNKTIELNTGHTTYFVEGPEFDPVLIDDNCILKSITNSYNQLETLAGSVFPIGTTTVIWTANDKANNKTESSHDITIKTGNEINIYPNPTLGVAYVFSGSSNIQEIQIIDINGKSITTREATNSLQNIDLRNYCSGIYIVKIFTDNGVFIRKVVKKK